MSCSSRPLRADLTALETYQHAAELPLECPITVFGGRDDRTVSKEELGGWSRHTTQEVRFGWVEGAHFYLQTARARLIDDIAADVECRARASIRRRRRLMLPSHEDGSGRRHQLRGDRRHRLPLSRRHR